MTRRLSISLPSIYEHSLVRTLKNIRDATRSDYEVILVAPFRPEIDGMDDRIVWVEEPEGTGTGCNAGHAAAFERMTGDFATAWVDDHHLVDGWDALAIETYERREALFHKAAGSKRPFVLGLRHCWPHHVGTLFGIYYPYFPLVRRSYLKKVGWYDPAFKQGFADSDLALRVWSSGGRCEWSEQSLIVAHHDDDRKQGAMYAQSDMDLAVGRWAPQYGAGWDTTTLRGFNIDIEPYYFPEFVEDHMIHHNDPGFRDLVLQRGWRPDGPAEYGH